MELEKATARRTTTADGHKVEWLKIKHMRFTEAQPGVKQFKYNHNPKAPVMDVSFVKRGSDPEDCGNPDNLVSLWPTGRPIQKAKKNDLMELMEFVPPCHHRRYSDIRVVNTHGPESIDVFTGRPDSNRDDE